MAKIYEAKKVGANAFEVVKSRVGRHYKKAAAAAGVFGAAVMTGPVYALTAAQDTEITTAYTATQTSVNNIIAGLLLVGLAITGFGIIWSLIRK